MEFFPDEILDIEVGECLLKSHDYILLFLTFCMMFESFMYPPFRNKLIHSCIGLLEHDGPE